jgi:hypothetical protein
MSPGKSIASRRSDIEADLGDKYHVSYTTLYDVPSSEFDIDKSLANQARFEALDEETVEIYREAVERGDVFPAVIAYRPGRSANARLVIIDGNHRLIAHERAGRPIDVYEIERGVKPQTVALMTYGFNTKHGKPTSEDERTYQAVYLIHNGATQEAAAAAVNVPLRLVRRAFNKAKADQRADEVGLDRREWDALGSAIRTRLLTISTDEGFKDASHLAYVARMTADDVFDLVTLLNTSKSGTRQRAIIKAQTQAYADRIQDAGAGVLGTSGRRPTSVKGRIGMVLGQILALPDDVDGVTHLYVDVERREAARRLVDGAERLRKLANALDSSVR